MPYLINIGYFAENRRGMGSRGYHFFRRGRLLHTFWGAIEVTISKKVHWCYDPIYRRYRFSSEERARAAYRRKMHDLREGEGYSRLPAGSRIRPPRRR